MLKLQGYPRFGSARVMDFIPTKIDLVIESSGENVKAAALKSCAQLFEIIKSKISVLQVSFAVPSH